MAQPGVSCPDIFHRFCEINPDVPDSTQVARDLTFSVVSYNILAECHRQRYDYSYTPEEFLCQDYRHELLVKELLYLDADVVCLQEVNPNYYSTRLLPALRRFGYKGTFVKKQDPLIDEGPATFFKTERFQLIHFQGASLLDDLLQNLEDNAKDLKNDVLGVVQQYLKRKEVINICRLQCRRTHAVVTIGNVHVVWDELRWPDVKCLEIASAIEKVSALAQDDMSPYVLCGDFNSLPDTVPYQLVREGKLSISSLAKLHNTSNIETSSGQKSLASMFESFFQFMLPPLESAYSTCQGKEPEITSHDASFVGCLDYLFYNSSFLGVTEVLRTVNRDIFQSVKGLPTKDFPSDHLSLKATFYIK